MSVIGKIQRQGDVLQGHIATLDYNVTFKLVQRPSSPNTQAPAYDIIAVNSAGIEVVIGKVWSKVIARGERRGEECLTLTFDDPSFAKKLNVAAFKDGSTSDWDIVFRHRQTA